jgi:hypothetical protein
MARAARTGRRPVRTAPRRRTEGPAASISDLTYGPAPHVRLRAVYGRSRCGAFAAGGTMTESVTAPIGPRTPRLPGEGIIACAQSGAGVAGVASATAEERR